MAPNTIVFHYFHPNISVMRHLYFLLLLLIIFTSCHSARRLARERGEEKQEYKAPSHAANNTKYTTETYIAAYKHIAIAQMHKYGIPASIILAQAILESGNGNSELARNANNHFGVKCTKDWQGKTYTHDAENKNECFRSYPDAEASFKDHIEFLRRPRYAALFDLGSSDYKGWAKGLKKAGYATNPKYPALLTGIIDKYNLHDYDRK
jgi:flagellum-specific peptidoglycan hydrolase FlgJ